MGFNFFGVSDRRECLGKTTPTALTGGKGGEDILT